MQNTFSQSGNDSKWFLTKIIFQNRYVALEAPPPFMANAIVNFHFDYPHTSLSTSLHLILGWDDLEIYTRDEDTSGGGFSSWEVGLGRVLGAVRRKDWVAFETHLKVPAENSSSLILKHVFLDCSRRCSWNNLIWQS